MDPKQIDLGPLPLPPVENPAPPASPPASPPSWPFPLPPFGGQPTPLPSPPSAPPPLPTGFVDVIKYFLGLTKSKWGKLVIAIPFIVIASFYFKDVRLGNLVPSHLEEQKNGIFTSETDGLYEVGYKDALGYIIYKNGKKVPRDGFAVALTTWEDYQKRPELFKNATRVEKADFPVLLFYNASGFDVSGIPCAIRRVADGQLLGHASDVALVRLMLPNRNGTYTVIHVDGTARTVDEKTWMREYMRVDRPDGPLHAPKEFEKLSNEELERLGYERLTPEEYRRRYGVDPPAEKTPPSK